jgi:pyruvate carboxylase
LKSVSRSSAGGGSKPVAVFRFLSEDWSPWIALVRMRERWPELRFEMKAGYLQIGE